MAKKTEPITVELDSRAVLARVNRVLAKQSKNLRKCRRDTAAYRKLGEYYLVTLEPVVQIERTKVDIGTFARELNVLEAFEQIGGVA